MDLAVGDSKIDMRRKWNWPLWTGFLFILAGFFSYPFFARFPVTRDFPWANLLFFGIGGVLLIAGLVRAFGKPKLYRGKILGSMLTVLSLLIVGFFAYAVFYTLRQLPPSTGAPRLGQKAPDFTLPDQNDKPVSLANLLSAPSSASTDRPSAVLLIFYRGFW